MQDTASLYSTTNGTPCGWMEMCISLLLLLLLMACIARYVMYGGCCWYCSAVLRWDKLQLHLAAAADGRLWRPAIHPRCSTAEKPICKLCWCFVSFIFTLYFLLANSCLPDIVRFCIWSSCPLLLRVALGYPPEKFLGFTAFFHQDICIIALMENPSRVTNTLWTRN